MAMAHALGAAALPAPEGAGAGVCVADRSGGAREVGLILLADFMGELGQPGPAERVQHRRDILLLRPGAVGRRRRGRVLGR